MGITSVRIFWVDINSIKYLFQHNFIEIIRILLLFLRGKANVRFENIIPYTIIILFSNGKNARR